MHTPRHARFKAATHNGSPARVVPALEAAFQSPVVMRLAPSGQATVVDPVSNSSTPVRPSRHGAASSPSPHALVASRSPITPKVVGSLLHMDDDVRSEHSAVLTAPPASPVHAGFKHASPAHQYVIQQQFPHEVHPYAFATANYDDPALAAILQAPSALSASSTPTTSRRRNSRTSPNITLEESPSKAKREVDPETGFLCSVCGKLCVCQSALAVHMRTHSGERPFSCPICRKQFSRKSHVKVHMRVHSGEKPYACEVCQRSFTQLSNLRAHSRVHTGERPFVCEICNRSFAVSSSLKAHMRVHTGSSVAKQYVCDVCFKCFAWPNSLEKHKMSHRSGRANRADGAGPGNSAGMVGDDGDDFDEDEEEEEEEENEEEPGDHGSESDEHDAEESGGQPIASASAAAAGGGGGGGAVAGDATAAQDSARTKSQDEHAAPVSAPTSAAEPATSAATARATGSSSSRATAGAGAGAATAQPMRARGAGLPDKLPPIAFNLGMPFAGLLTAPFAVALSPSPPPLSSARSAQPHSSSSALFHADNAPMDMASVPLDMSGAATHTTHNYSHLADLDAILHGTSGPPRPLEFEEDPDSEVDDDNMDDDA
jgi:hypothetical protein